MKLHLIIQRFLTRFTPSFGGGRGEVLFFLITCSLLTTNLHGQDLNRLNKNDFLKVNGGLNFNTIFYRGTGAFVGRRAPLLWNASGNLNFDLLGYSMPLSFNFSNRGLTGARSVNRFILAPTYKWIKTQIGTATLSFSPYTYSGLTIKGAAIELTPDGPFKIAVIAGSLQEALPFDGALTDNQKPAYKRWAGGFKIGYSAKGSTIEYVLFAAKDNKSSIPPTPESYQVTPASNLTSSISFKRQFFKKWDVDVIYSSSAYTSNARTPDDANSTFSLLKPFFKTRINTRFFNQYGFSTGYNAGKFQIMAKYEHVDPGYTTIGSGATNNDFENYTLAPAFSVFKDVIKVNANVGMQRNNLDGKKPETSLRWVGSINASATIHQTWMLQSGYSNFTNFTNQRLSPNPFFRSDLDSLSIYQVSQNANAVLAHPFGSKDLPQSLCLMGNYQETQSGRGSDTASPAKTKVYMTNLGYTVALAKQGITVGAAANYYVTQMPMGNTAAFGPSLSVNGGLFNKKINCGSSFAYNQTWLNGASQSGVVTANLRASYSLSKGGGKGDKKKEGNTESNSGVGVMEKLKEKLFTNHSFSMNLNYMSRLPGGFVTNQSGNEFTLTLNYSWGF